MSDTTLIAEDLRQHLQLCRDTLSLVEREHVALRGPAGGLPAQFHADKKDLLSRLSESLNRLRQHRMEWTRLGLAERSRHPEVVTLMRQSQDVIMRIIMLDRANEQALMRRGAGAVPPVPA